jgi:hypothetical protein
MKSKKKKPSASFFFRGSAVESTGAFATSHNSCEARRH